ncbi:interleukin-8-like [Chiloscyllium plagiosum]|uniref:interleukin-8-like n=1 Tax=Chiloscyllium plagiosum TaxID=36176 RepID=UPI001CB887E2|nr:interleukin-8-like [Chiloscyllium plagiosum]
MGELDTTAAERSNKNNIKTIIQEKTMNSKVTLAVLTLFVLYVVSTEAASLRHAAVSLRCQCIKTNSKFIHPNHMENIEIIPSGPHCPTVEIIATLKSGSPVCLNPNAVWVKMIIDIMTNSSKKNKAH